MVNEQVPVPLIYVEGEKNRLRSGTGPTERKIKMSHNSTSCTMGGLLFNTSAYRYESYVVDVAHRIPRRGLWAVLQTGSAPETSTLKFYGRDKSACALELG